MATLRELEAELAAKLYLGFERVVATLRKLEAWATVEVRTEAARVAVAKVVAVTMRLSSGGSGQAAVGVSLDDSEWAAANCNRRRPGEPWHGCRGGNLAEKAP